MPELQDGTSIQVQGSARQPYVLKNIDGVYSCSCPAWRNQSLPIDRRTCKHLRRYRGEQSEAERIGSVISLRQPQPRTQPFVPPLLLAENWDGDADPTGWWLSEKLDGVRAYWDGQRFLSRQGNVFHAPSWFTEGLPLEPLDGELWIGRKQFQKTVSVVRRQNGAEHWREVRYLIFDAPGHDTYFERRLQFLHSMTAVCRPLYALVHTHQRCVGRQHLSQELDRVTALGGEGLMLRQPESWYEPRRSSTLCKVKRFVDGEAQVIGHEPGRGRHHGRLGALLVETSDAVQFAVGTGLSDAEREHPPAIGTTISFRYQELTDAGVPRFPVYAGIREDSALSFKINQGDPTMAAMQIKRRFEYVGGGSDKFWEVGIAGSEVTVCFGRNGTSGQTQTRTLPDAMAAEKHATKLIREKTAKGYVEVRRAA